VPGTSRVAATAFFLASAVALAGCSSQQAGSRYATCIDEGAAARPGSLPDDIPMLQQTELTDVTRKEGFVAVSGVATDLTVDDLYEPMVRSVRAQGFDVLAQENEGFEAEVYFSKSTDVAGIASLRKGPCPTQVTYSVLYDPLETKEGKEAAAKTRRAARSR
jgi:hypothetical protein